MDERGGALLRQPADPADGDDHHLSVQQPDGPFRQADLDVDHRPDADGGRLFPPVFPGQSGVSEAQPGCPGAD